MKTTDDLKDFHKVRFDGIDGNLLDRGSHWCREVVGHPATLLFLECVDDQLLPIAIIGNPRPLDGKWDVAFDGWKVLYFLFEDVSDAVLFKLSVPRGDA